MRKTTVLHSLLLFIAVTAFPAVCAAADTLVLDELIARAEANNPAVAAMRARYEAASERIPQAGALEDPMFGMGFMAVEVNNFAFDRMPMTSKFVELSQKIPFYGKRPLKAEAATHGYEAAEAEYREELVNIRAEVKKAFYELWLAKKAQDTVARNMELARALREVVQTRYGTGNGPFGDVLKAQLEETGLVKERLELETEERTARAMLGALTGSDMPVTGEVGDISATALPADKDALVARARGSRPSVLAAEARIKEADARVDIARKEFFPDFAATLRYHHVETLRDGMAQSDRIDAMITVNLPVWREARLEPGVREAAAERAMAEGQRESELTTIRYRVDSLVGEIEQADRTLKLYKDVAIPQATEGLDAILAGYSAGKADFMGLIDSRRMLLEYELGYYRTLAGREKSVAELEAVVGGF